MDGDMTWPISIMMFPFTNALSFGLSSVAAAGCVAVWFAVKRVVKHLNVECCGAAQALSFEDPWSTTRLPVPSIHSSPCKSLTVVFPAYNESSRMDAAIHEAVEYLQVRRKRDPAFSFEIILVDDGSTDNTYNKAMKYVEHHGIDTFRALRFPVNRGKGAAVRAGVLAARGELVLFADADGATQFSDVSQLHSRMTSIACSRGAGEQEGMFSSIADQHGFVLGSRAHLQKSKAVVQRAWYRNAMMHGFHYLVTFVAGHSIRDTQCGFKLLTRRTARLLFTNLRIQRWCFDVELVYLARHFRVPMVEEDVTWDEVPGTKIRWWAPASMAKDMLLVKLAYGSGSWVARSEEAAVSS